MVNFVSWVGLISFLAIAWVLLRYYVRAKEVCNAVSAAASKDFFDKTDRLLADMEVLPDIIINSIKTMVAIANRRNASFFVLQILHARHTKQNVGKDGDLISAFKNLSEEQRDLFGGAVVAWLQYVSHKSVYMRHRIAWEFLKAKRKTVDPTIAQRDTGLRALSGASDSQFC